MIRRLSRRLFQQHRPLSAAPTHSKLVRYRPKTDIAGCRDQRQMDRASCEVLSLRGARRSGRACDRLLSGPRYRVQHIPRMVAGRVGGDSARGSGADCEVRPHTCPQFAQVRRNIRRRERTVASRKWRGMNRRNQMDSFADHHRKEAERTRETAKQAVSVRDRAF